MSGAFLLLSISLSVCMPDCSHKFLSRTAYEIAATHRDAERARARIRA
jgi:hypothetical protein